MDAKYSLQQKFLLRFLASFYDFKTIFLERWEKLPQNLLWEGNLHEHKKYEDKDKLCQLEMILIQCLRAQSLLCWLLPPEAVFLEHHLSKAVEHGVRLAPLTLRTGCAETSALANCEHGSSGTNFFDLYPLSSHFIHFVSMFWVNAMSCLFFKETPYFCQSVSFTFIKLHIYQHIKSSTFFYIHLSVFFLFTFL